MKIFVYNLRDYDEKSNFDALQKEFDFEYASTSADPTLETAHLAEGCDYISIITTPINRELMARFHDMGIKMICTRSIGWDHIDMKAAADYGIKISHSVYAPGAVSDYTIMMMLMVNRKMKRIMQRADVQNYTLKGIQGINLNEQTVGVIGTGRIGTEVIRCLSGFGCRLLANDIVQNDTAAQFAEYVPLDTLLSESDIITLHMPLIDSTYHMIDASAIAKMKDGARLINTARGGLIDSRALIDAIESGKLSGVGLDCVENEFGLYYNELGETPLDNEYLAILRNFPNVVVTPHMAFYSDRTVHDMVYSNVAACAFNETGEENSYLVS